MFGKLSSDESYEIDADLECVVGLFDSRRTLLQMGQPVGHLDCEPSVGSPLPSRLELDLDDHPTWATPSLVTFDLSNCDDEDLVLDSVYVALPDDEGVNRLFLTTSLRGKHSALYKTEITLDEFELELDPDSLLTA